MLSGWARRESKEPQKHWEIDNTTAPAHATAHALPQNPSEKLPANRQQIIATITDELRHLSVDELLGILATVQQKPVGRDCSPASERSHSEGTNDTP